MTLVGFWRRGLFMTQKGTVANWEAAEPCGRDPPGSGWTRGREDPAPAIC